MKKTLKHEIYRCLTSHSSPLSVREVTAWINRYTDHEVSENNIATRLSEMATDPEFRIKGEFAKADNGNMYKRWFVPSVNTDAQGELF
jgi:hypothetical protein